MTKDTAKFDPYSYQHVQWPVCCVNIVVQFWMQFKFTFPDSLFECYSFYKVQASYVVTRTKEVSVF